MWRKGSRSLREDRVEAAITPAVAAVRDAKDPDGARLHVSAECWSSFLVALKAALCGG